MHPHHPHPDSTAPGHMTAAIERDRIEKDAISRRSAHSPIQVPARDSFSGLSYYPIDLAFRRAGIRLDPYSGPDAAEFGMSTSDGRVRAARLVGSLAFDLLDGRYRLTAHDLSMGQEESLFVPSLDATSGRTTYGAGRYLDLVPGPDGRYLLDFNRAYHPFCACSPHYSCPLTPAENRLPVAVEAGERLPLGPRAASPTTDSATSMTVVRGG